MDREQLIRDLKRDEGLRLEAYPDGDGYSIGYGHHSQTLKAGETCTETDAEVWLERDIETAIIDAKTLAGAAWDELNDTRRNVLINMAYNMGRGTLSKFKKMWKAIPSGDYNEAAFQMLNSRWAKQVGARANRLAHEMKTGEFDVVPF